MMMEPSHGSDSSQGGQERSRRDTLRSTKRAWVPLDEQLPPGLATPSLGDAKQESVQQWLDSGCFGSVNENFQQIVDHAVLSPEQGMVHVTEKDDMRSRHQFPETPTLSRGTSFNSRHSAVSIPQSIPDWLEFWEKDPVEILLDLGFGAEEPDICTQIPARFLGCGSAARGINIRVFLEAQKQRMDVENRNLYGCFRQLKMLDHVANAFSCLLSDVHTLWSKAEEKDEEESVQRTSVRGRQEQQRVGEVFRRASKQNIRGDYSSEVSGSSKNREEFSIISAKPEAPGVRLPAMTNNLDQSLSISLAEQRSPQASDDLKPCHPPQAVLKKQWPYSPMPTQQAPPSRVSEGSVKDRTQKENKVKVLSSVSGAPDSFEMEEVQSLEEEIGDPPDLTSGAVGATMQRTDSCQSDSSGFLEEPAEPLALQMPSLPGGLFPAEDGCRRPGGQSQRLGSAQPCQRDSEEPGSTSRLSTSSSREDQSVIEQKSLASVVQRAAQLEATEGQPELLTSDVALDSTTPRGEHPGTDSHQRQPPPVPQAQHEASGSVTPCRCDHPLELSMVTRVTREKDRYLRPKRGGEASVQSPRWESPASPGGGGAQGKTLPIGSEASGGAQRNKLCPDFNQTPGSPPQHVPRPSKAVPSAADLSQTSETAIPCLDELLGAAAPQAKPRPGAWGQTPPRAGSEMGALPPRADSHAMSSASVTVQMSSGLVAAAQSAVALGTYSRRTTLECTVDDPVSVTGPPLLGTEARQFKDVSVQTCLWAPGSWRCCAVPSNEAQPLPKSISLDTGFPSNCPVDTCRATPARCWDCCHRHPHCHGWGRSPGPAAPVRRLGPRSHCHQEAQWGETVEVPQDAAERKLCLGPVSELEAMTALCRSFQEHLEGTEQILTGQQALFFRDMSEEERKEAEQLQALRQALRQQVEELEFQLGDRVRQLREGILLELELLTGEHPACCTNLHQCDWTEGMKGQAPYAQAHPATAPRAVPSAEDGQWVPCLGIAHAAASPLLSSESHTGTPPPAWEELGSALVSNCPVGEEDTDVCL